MTEELVVALGPSIVQVVAHDKYDWRLRDHLQGFSSHPQALPDVRIRLGLGSAGNTRVPVRSNEVRVEATRPEAIVISADLVMSPRAALRRVKRILQPAHWSRGRWSLLLRNSFELGSLANLEYTHGYAAVHSATVMGEGGCILLLGGNGAGKSTLACALIASLGLRLLSDNFTPCDGEYALGFPGKPRAKPGDQLPDMKTVAGKSPVRGIVALDMRLAESPSERSRQLLAYLGQSYDSHRGTGFGKIFGATPEDEARNDQRVAERLAGLPFLTHNYRSANWLAVEKFIGENCGISSLQP